MEIMYNILRKIDIVITAADRRLTSRRILLLAFGFAALWLTLFLLFKVEIYRDVANCYAWYSREFGRGHWEGLSIAALPPLNIFLGGMLVKCGVEAYQGLMFLSGAFFALTIFPLYALLKIFLPKKSAAWGCFFFIMTPKIIRFSCSGLLESTRDFFLVSAVWLLFCIWRDRAKIYHFILLGGALGLLALSRGEGCVMAGVLFLALFIRPKGCCSFGKKILLPAMLAALSAIAVVSPRLIETWKLTGYPVTDTRCIGLLKSLPFSSRIFQDKRPQEKIQIDPAWDKTMPHKKMTFTEKICQLVELPEQMSRGGYEVYLPFAAVGIFGLLRRRAWNREYSFLLIFSIAVSVIMGFFSMAFRYFVFLVPLLMVFTVCGMILILNEAKQYQLQSVCLLIFSGIALIQTYNAWGELFEQREGRRKIQMAQFLKQNKKRFLPAGEQNRKLIVESEGLPEIIYRVDEGRLREYGRNYNSPTQLRGFDVFIIEKNEKKRCNLLLARKDLQEIAHPLEDEYLLLAVKHKDEKR